MARKKIVLVIVEGPSDDTALGILLHRLFDKNKVYIKIMYGDITSDYCIAPKDVVKKLGDIVRGYAGEMHLTKSHFQEVIHIVDMDGAYIPDSAIIEDGTAVKPIYSLTHIKTEKADKLIEGHRHKQDKLNRISRLDRVWVNIPYRVYYMSSNLDHVLYDKLNTTDEEKENNAYRFAQKYKDDIDGFLDFMCNSDFSKVDDYMYSWEFIKKDLHSLERYSNFGLCFADIRKARKEHL